ncbi:DUF2065 domain-containing protein [Salinimonas marina]|uniref:DUF2065 domain-containing protein n=1 Tax=Salinimonas marina TaxID=2785918 RepID=A0A7S9HEE2_9ALTE|nr:DUF2065 domain-containing protein [Salinimonas marina]
MALVIALVLVLEGLGPFCMPNRWRLFLLQLSQQRAASLQKYGGIMVIVGLVSLYYLWP